MAVLRQILNVNLIVGLAIATGCAATDPTAPSSELSDPAGSASTSTPSESQPAPEADSEPMGELPLPEDCTDPSLTQTQLNVCAKASYNAADQRLNQVYQQLQAQLSPADVELLTTAELAWLDYRDTNCKFAESIYAGGSIQPTIYFNCLERVTDARIAELEVQLKARSR